MLRKIDLLREMELLKQMEMFRDLQNLEDAGESAKSSAPARGQPAKNKETAK